EVDLPMLDNRVVPVGNINRSVRSLAYIHRTERDVPRLDQLAEFLGRKPTPVIPQPVAANPMRSEVIRNQVSSPILRQMAPTDDLQAAKLRLTGIQSCDDAFGPR